MKTLLDLAKLVNGEVVGDKTMIISGVSEIQNGRESTISFLGNPRYKKYLSSTKASAVIVDDRSFLNDKSGIVHAGIGKLDFKEENLIENLKTFYNTILKSKSENIKKTSGSFIKKVSIASTMGFGLEINVGSLQ